MSLGAYYLIVLACYVQYKTVHEYKMPYEILRYAAVVSVREA